MTGTTNEFTIYDGAVSYACTASLAIRQGEVFVTDLTILHVCLTDYELPAEEGYDPEPVVLDIRHTFQQIELEKRLQEDFADEILQKCIYYASANAGVM